MSKATAGSVSGDQSGEGLGDPLTCGEDLAHNLRRAIEVAPERCPGCSDYHIAHTAKRLSGRTVWARGGRTALLDTFQPLLAELAAGDAERLNVVIAACADTAVLSICAHAVWLGGLLGRINFTVLDKCGTPLVLCEDYAARHGLTIHTDIVDLTKTLKCFPADLIVLHNFLSYSPEDQHERLLRTLGEWLTVAGRLVIWNNIVTPDNRNRFLQFLRAQVTDVTAMIGDGRIEIGDVKELHARLERTFEQAKSNTHRVADTESVSRLIAAVGLEVRSAEETFPVGLVPDSAPISFPCVTIVAGRAVAAAALTVLMSVSGHFLPSPARLVMSAYRPNADMRHPGCQF